MKKLLVALALAAFATTASAAIAGGSHDLSARPGALISSCQFCHAPHNVNTGVQGAPLWNRNMGAGYAVYTSNTLNDATVTLGANSLTCLSCHDGAGDMGATYTGSRGFAAVTPIGVGSFANVGTALTNDHPVGVNYVPGGEYDSVANVTGSGLTLYGAAGSESVECASCHEPHGTSDGLTGGPSFLRVAATALCAECHIK